jgi:hypothetical protein
MTVYSHRTELDPNAPWAIPPGIGKTVGLGSLIGIVVSLVGIVAGMRAAGIEWGSALALGFFISFWGGLGFGSMMGGVAYLVRADAAAKAEVAAERAAATAGRADAPAAEDRPAIPLPPKTATPANRTDPATPAGSRTVRRSTPATETAATASR